MKIKLLETVKHGGHEYVADDEVTVADDLGEYFCTAGWAQDLAGDIKTGDRLAAHGAQLEVDNGRMALQITARG